MLTRTRRDVTMAQAARSPANNVRLDHLLVAEMIEPHSRVLDVGCGDGELLKLLESRGVDGRGIELSREGVNECVAKGLAVIQGDADADLADYPNDAFDYVVLDEAQAVDAAFADEQNRQSNPGGDGQNERHRHHRV